MSTSPSPASNGSTGRCPAPGSIYKEVKNLIAYEVENAYAESVFKGFVITCAKYVYVSEYEEHVEKLFNLFAELRKDRNLPVKYTKKGRLIRQSLFESKRSYSKLQVDISIVRKAIDDGISLLKADGSAKSREEIYTERKSLGKRRKYKTMSIEEKVLNHKIPEIINMVMQSSLLDSVRNHILRKAVDMLEEQINTAPTA